MWFIPMLITPWKGTTNTRGVIDGDFLVGEDLEVKASVDGGKVYEGTVGVEKKEKNDIIIIF